MRSPDETFEPPAGQRALDGLEAGLSDDERELLDRLASGIARRGLTPAALFVLESMTPLGYVGSQLMLFFRPLVHGLWSDPQTYDRIASILERRGSIELLVRRLEASS